MSLSLEPYRHALKKIILKQKGRIELALLAEYVLSMQGSLGSIPTAADAAGGSTCQEAEAGGGATGILDYIRSSGPAVTVSEEMSPLKTRHGAEEAAQWFRALSAPPGEAQRPG